MDSIFSPFWSRRRWRRMLLAPCLGFALYIAFSYKDPTFDAVRSSSAEIGTTTITPICVHETVTEQAGFEHEVEKPLQPHSFRSDGLLEVNPNGRHPIYDLIEHAEADWDKKLNRQSKTLAEAVTEYKRRYGRAPPKGFDKWWLYCEKYNVQLPDEYDRIYHDLEPFWGMDPVDLNKLQTELESERDSYTIGKTENSRLRIVASALPEPGPDSPTRNFIAQANEIIDMLKEVSEFIPPFRAVFSPHDNPDRTIDWELKTQALQAAAAGTYIDIKTPPSPKYSGWPSGCSPESPLRHTTFNIDVPPSPPTKKTFIYDHQKAMDPCIHPSLLYHHGQFVSKDEGPVPQQIMIPQFSYCATRMHYDIVTAINWVDGIPQDMDPDFQNRLDERLSWRGTTTGMWHAEDTRWRSQHRIRLVGWAGERNGTASVLRPTKSRSERVGEGRPVAKSRLNPAMLDVTFVGKPHSCTQAVCETMQQQFEFRDYQSLETAANYKYVLDLDGNGWSSRYKRLIMSNSLIFKSTVYPEWYQERIQPWKHYVPCQLDWSDLYDSLTFFRGDLYGEDAHEELAAKIALAGRDWAKTFWREQDIIAYMFRLFLEYARVMSLDREAMSYKDRDSTS